MNKTEEQLTSALRRRDADLTVHDELAAVLADDNIVRFTLQRDTTRSRRPFLLMAAAASIVIVGAGGLIWAPRTEPSPPATADSPTDSELSVSQQPANEPADGNQVPNAATVPSPGCADPAGRTLVPNVSGLSYPEAVDAMISAGLDFEVVRELPVDGETASDDLHTVVAQNVAPAESVECGTVVRITAAYRAGILYVVQPGDTYESIAESQGIPVETLLEFSGLSVAELDAVGESTTTVLNVGRAIPLSAGQPTLTTVVTTTR